MEKWVNTLCRECKQEIAEDEPLGITAEMAAIGAVIIAEAKIGCDLLDLANDVYLMMKASEMKRPPALYVAHSRD